MKYDFNQIEPKWQDHWDKAGTYKTPNPSEASFDPAKPKFYVLDMFPYPSGVGLHVGHPLGYIATDIVARYKRMRGFNVLHPMGFDAFGLPAEQFAVEHGVHPRITTEKNIENMVRQLRGLGLGYDWDRQIATTDVGYYKWTQWIFLQLFNSYFDPAENKARPISELVRLLQAGDVEIGPDGELVFEGAMTGLEPIVGSEPGTRRWYDMTPEQQNALIDEYRLAYLAEVPVNWCPQLGTVLANEEVTNEGRSERGNYPVYKRPLKQWMLRITAYAERLIDDLDLVSWPESVKLLQRNWVGKSSGAQVDFAVDGVYETGETPIITVFTTRPDTLFGATYMVLAPEHELVDQITSEAHRDAVDEYRKQAAAKADVDRQAETKDKTGVFTGAYAINPVNGQPIPIWIADYVMMGYGTGAIMAVPGHDERDFEFAKKFDLPVKLVVIPEFKNQDFARYIASRRSESAIADREIDFAWIYDAGETSPVPFQTQISIIKEANAAGQLLDCIQQDERNYFIHYNINAFDPKQLGAYCVGGIEPPYLGPGECFNSSNSEISLNGLPTAAAKKTITTWLERKGIGKAQTQYKLRDWLFSRQRYWGEPFPVLHELDEAGLPTGRVIAVEEKDLPVQHPHMDDFQPHATEDPNAPPQPPLGRAGDEWKFVTIAGKRYQRELNTMPQWAGSCWYYLRYLDPDDDERFVSQEAERYWMVSRKKSGGTHAGGVDLYVGGVEHAVLHLLYARFWHKVLFDLGHVSTPEPFGRLFNQGYIQAYAYTDERGVYVPAAEVVNAEGKPAYEVQGDPSQKFTWNGQPVTERYGKMGKSLKNAVAPDEVCEQYGADTLRLYEMYMGPLDQSKPWATRDIVGVHRFLQRLWRNFVNEDTGVSLIIETAPTKELARFTHKTIKRVSESMETMSFNVAIAALIELNNKLVAMEQVPHWVAEQMVRMLAPFAPHICEELWSRLGNEPSVVDADWPTWDADMLVEDEVEMPVQVNGKLRGKIVVPTGADDAAIEAAAKADDNVAVHLDGKTIRKVIVIKGKMINIVAN